TNFILRRNGIGPVAQDVFHRLSGFGEAQDLSPTIGAATSVNSTPYALGSRPRRTRVSGPLIGDPAHRYQCSFPRHGAKVRLKYPGDGTPDGYLVGFPA